MVDRGGILKKDVVGRELGKLTNWNRVDFGLEIGQLENWWSMIGNWIVKVKTKKKKKKKKKNRKEKKCDKKRRNGGTEATPAGGWRNRPVAHVNVSSRPTDGCVVSE